MFDKLGPAPIPACGCRITKIAEDQFLTCLGRLWGVMSAAAAPPLSQKTNGYSPENSGAFFISEVVSTRS